MKTNKVRILTLIMTLVLIVCMSVPAFAYGTKPSNVGYPPSKGMWLITSNSSVSTEVFLYDISEVSYIYREYTTYMWLFYDDNGNEISVSRYQYSSSSGWVNKSTVSAIPTSHKVSWSNCTVITENELKLVFAEPIYIDQPEIPDWNYSTYKYGFMLHDPWNDTYFFYAYDVKATALGNPVIRIDNPTKGVKYEYNNNSKLWSVANYLELEGDSISFSSPFEVVWSSYDIYNADGTLFFRGTPTLTMVLEPVEMSGVLTEIVTILPIGLACGIGYLALRKALAILRQILQQA